MRILLTGINGYIGSVLAPYLINQGIEVTGLDTGFYRDGILYNQNKYISYLPCIINKDLRHIKQKDLYGFDAVVHLAELSNDPLGENDPEITYDINYQGSLNLANLSKQAGIKKFIYTSSCSVYGFNDRDILTEKSPTDPQTVYAKCKVLVETNVSKLADKNFSPIFLRNATAYGASPHMRFDIVLNNLAGWAWTTNKIVMSSDGSPWRPLVHVVDICQAILCALQAPQDNIHNQVFNVGNNESNYQIREVAGVVANVFPECELSIGKNDADQRSYRVNFDKINQFLPGFKCEWNIEKGARQLYDVFERINMNKDIFSFRAFTRLKQLEYLQNTQQVDKQLYWNY